MKLGVPIKIAPEIFAHIIRKELEPCSQKFRVCRAPRVLERAHLPSRLAPAVIRQVIGLLGVTLQACRHNVCPFRLATARPRDDVVIGQIGR